MPIIYAYAYVYVGTYLQIILIKHWMRGFGFFNEKGSVQSRIINWLKTKLLTMISIISLINRVRLWLQAGVVSKECH